MKSLEDAYKALEAVKDVGSELVDAVKEALASEKGKTEKAEARAATEKQRGIDEVKKKNKEAEGLRKFKTIATTLGYDPEEHEDLEEWAEEAKGLIAKGAEGGDGGKGKESPEFKQMAKDMKALNKRFDAAQEELKTEKATATDLKKKSVNGRIRSALLKVLNEKVYGADLVADNLISTGRVRVDEDDEEKVVFVGKDKEAVDFDDGITKLLEDRKDIVKNTQKGGGGSGGGGGGGDDKDKKKTPEERKKELRQMARGGSRI